MSIMAYIKIILSLILSVVTALGSVSLPCFLPGNAPQGVREEAEPLTAEPESEEVFAAVSDKLELPLITETAALRERTGYLNAALTGSIPAGSPVPKAAQMAAISFGDQALPAPKSFGSGTPSKPL